jgi:tRNA A-37 threonylcarbamoyl transferase component Bud32
LYDDFVAGELHQIMLSFGRSISMEQANAMVRDADLDGDGEISMEEFQKVMARTQKSELWGDAATSAKQLKLNSSNRVSKVGQTVSDSDDPDFDADIDFVVSLRNRKMTCRASSNAEKRAWVNALGSATKVRSYSSRQLDTGMESHEAVRALHSQMRKKVSLQDLDIGDIIGSGSMGTVRLSVHIPTGVRVAVKIIPKRKFFMNKKLQQTTQRELQMLDKIASFEHPYIVQMLGYIDAEDNVYIILELCEGGELLEQLEKMGSYCEADAAAVIERTTDTLGYLHGKGIVHRDVKPENLLLSTVGDSNSIKVADFGLANIIEGGSLQTVCGSPAYMAPEVHKMADYDEKVDLWSVGVMLYLLLSGTLPFAPPQMMEKAAAGDYSFSGKIWKSVSTEAKDLISNLLVADPAKRFGVAETLNHPWITGVDRAHVNLEAARKALALFAAKRKFKGIAHAVVASKRMSKLMASFAAPKLDKGRELLQDAKYTASGAAFGVAKRAKKDTPDASEGRDSKMEMVRKWLEGCHLGVYADQFEEEGYDDLEAIKELEADEVEELFEEISMKKGHRRNFKKRLYALQNGHALPRYDAAGLLIGDGSEYAKLSMPSGSVDQDEFQLGVSIGRVRTTEATRTSADTDTVGKHASHRRIRSPPRPQRQKQVVIR